MYMRRKDAMRNSTDSSSFHFHWPVYLKVNGLICSFGVITYIISTLVSSSDPQKHGSSFSSFSFSALFWAYIGAVVRNTSLVILLTKLTSSQPPLAKSQRVEPTKTENIEMALRMLLVACIGEAVCVVTKLLFFPPITWFLHVVRCE